jgi:FAD/FMN-containing dehydrogenase
VGGLGLTGLVTWAELQLVRIPGPWLECESVPFGGLAEFLEVAAGSDEAFEHTVAWFDALAGGERLGRGVLFRANRTAETGRGAPARRAIPVPFALPGSALNRWTVGAFNRLYALAHRRRGRRLVHQEAFFFPLDRLSGWNRLYGRAGFVQLQLVVPRAAASAGLARVLERIAASGQGAFLSVLKTFGAARSPGLLSFPREGVTLAVDLPQRGPPLAALLREVHAIVVDHGGALYPAKDAHMTPGTFAAGFPAWREFAGFVDPRFSSSFWRRVTGTGEAP